MSALEDRVRDALRADAETVRPGTIPGVPPRPARPAVNRARVRRVRILLPLGAAVAVIAIVAGLSLAAPRLLSGGRAGSGPASSPPAGLPAPSSGPQPSVSLSPAAQPVLAADASRGVPSSAPTPGRPPFYVTITVVAPTTTDTVVVRNTATGQITDEIHPPGSSVFAGLAATSGDHTFITAIDPGTGCAPVQLYRFQLNQLGVPGPLQPLNIALPGSVPQGEGDLAITPDGDTIAYDAAGCNAAEQSEVGVITLATRQTRAWAVAGLSAADLSSSRIMNLSLSNDGQLLGFSTFDGTSVLRTSAPAGSLFAHARLVSRTVIWGAVAGDGQSLYGCAVSPYRSGQPLPSVGRLTYGQFSLTGRQDHVIASWPRVTGPQCYASMDPAGNYLLMQFPAIAHGTADWSLPAVLDLATGQRTAINAPAFYGPFDIAW